MLFSLFLMHAQIEKETKLILLLGNNKESKEIKNNRVLMHPYKENKKQTFVRI